MPTIIIDGYRFRFFSLDRHEPPHVHVLRAEGRAKIWLSPVALEWARGYNDRELNRILALTREHQAHLLEVWREYFDH